jgi:hypothetical protein
MTIQRSTLVLAGSLFLTAAAFASSRDDKPERTVIVQEYSGGSGSTMIPAEATAFSDYSVALPNRESGRLNK